MQTATLVFAASGCVLAGLSFAVSLKTALELKKAKTNVDHEIVKVKQKVSHNASVVKRALGEIQL